MPPNFPIELTTDALDAFFPNISTIYGAGKDVDIKIYSHNAPYVNIVKNNVTGNISIGFDNIVDGKVVSKMAATLNFALDI
jgi:hypothetical protein